MEYNSDTFNGEINNRLNASFKIPLKAPPSRLAKNKALDEEEDEEVANETFSSPLLSCEETQENDISWRQIKNQRINHDVDTFNQDSIPSLRKRKAEKEERTIYGRDSSYPAELNFLIQTLCCNLCNASMNSIKSARDHYESKAHDKKVTNWLVEWCKKTGEPMPKFRKLVKDGPVGPNVLHCESCDLPLTSLQHASQHYNGKRHKMVVALLVNPSGSGYYDKDGKWLRQCTKPNVTYPRYGIGDTFVKNNATAITVPATEKPQQQPQPAADGSTFCDMCNISVTSDQQMKMHLQGSKHAKKLKLLGKPPYAPPGDTILASMQTTQSNPHNDISMYRTPSGSYYCMICNMTLPDSAIFIQHLDSKRHLNNVKKSSEKTSVITKET